MIPEPCDTCKYSYIMRDYTQEVLGWNCHAFTLGDIGKIERKTCGTTHEMYLEDNDKLATKFLNKGW